MYNKTVLDHFQNPRNLAEMKNPDAVGMGASQVCGDVMTLFLSISDGRVKDATYKTMGCGAAIASGSILTELLKGKSLQEAEGFTKDTLVSALGGLPAIKMHCPELAMEALRAAFTDYRQRKESGKKN
jgi:nitrogen fixation protein NifU and related proteins